ncbi:hypothetical protein DL93DRAFT_2051527 [Clavulina sp. PMI_390]|nr:hypothetical protein DL93DRAFT_2051527 [Clavulina sp. PMI_390]
MNRNELAKIVSSLRNPKIHLPFFKFKPHTVPTRWNLYRNLLRYAPTDEVRHSIRQVFRAKRHITSPTTATAYLKRGHERLDAFLRNQRSDTPRPRVAHTLRSTPVLDMRLVKLPRVRSKPRLTGGFVRPSLFNRALPRMKPQPPEISGMIVKRVKGRARRIEQQTYWKEAQSDMKLEAQFERNALSLAQRSSAHRKEKEIPELVYHEKLGQWLDPIKSQLSQIDKSFAADEARFNSKFSPQMVAHVKRARTYRILNKTRERQREAAGEITPASLRRGRKGVPAHVWINLSEEERKTISERRKWAITETHKRAAAQG